MNRIVYAGTVENAYEEHVSKYFEFIIPEKGGKGGRIILSENGDRDKERSVSFGWGEIAVIPPYRKYRADTCGKGDLHVLLEQAMLPLKEPFTMTDAENEGVRHATIQAAEYYRSEYNKKDAVLAALGELLVSYVNLFLGEGAKTSPVVELVKTSIEANLSDSMYALDDEIKKLPLNYDYVRKLFKKETGVTPHGYLMAKRMERARSMLTSGLSNRYSNYSVSQIAEACGFAEPLYFSRVFKKYYGSAPSDYAKNKD